eukprot:3970249-Amphidinium_carterae.1
MLIVTAFQGDTQIGAQHDHLFGCVGGEHRPPNILYGLQFLVWFEVWSPAWGSCGGRARVGV